MADYVLIESRDPFEYSDTGYFYEVAAALSKAGNNVPFFLVQNGVLTARKGISNSAVDKLQKAAPGVKILADEFSLRERAIPGGKHRTSSDGQRCADVGPLLKMIGHGIWIKYACTMNDIFKQ